MTTMNFKSHSAEAVNSAVAKIFANVSVNEVAQKFTKKLIKTKNAQGLKGLSASMEIRVSDDFRVKVDAAVFDYGRYIVNVVIEEKNANRFMEFGRKHYDGENINLISFSQIFADVEAAMYEIVDDYLYLIEHWVIKNNELDLQYNYDVRIWEELTGLNFAEVVMGVDPMPESEESAEVTEEDDDMELAIERLADDIANRADRTMGDYFVDVTHNMWNANDAIDEDRLRELLFDKLDGVAEIDFAEPDDKDILRIWFNRPIKKDAPCLDAENVESGFGDMYWEMYGESERVADTIEKYLGSYTPSYLDQFGECVITIYWDEFNEQDMKMLIEDNIFAMSVRDTLYKRGVIENLSGFLVYDDGVYVTVDYDKMFNKVETNVCCICGKTYEGYGYNADPLAKGRCCNECNADVIKRRVEYQWASDILRPMIEKLGDNREMMQVSEGEVNGVPVTIELMRPRDKYMVFVKTDHQKGYEWFRLFNDYLEYAYNN